MSDMTKERFKPPRKVIRVGSPSLHPLAPKPRRAGFRCRSRKACPGRLPRHLFQIGERCVDHAGAGLAGVVDVAVEPAVDKDNRALARLTVAAIGVARGESQATDIAQ